MTSKNVISITPEMRKRYIHKSLIRDITSFCIYALIVSSIDVVLLKFLSLPYWLLALIFIFLMIFAKILHEKYIIPIIWKHTVILNQNQFEAFGGKTIFNPPDKFKDIWKYQGELDFDYVIAQYNGFRTSKWTNVEPYVVYFLNSEDAVYFKLVCLENE